MKCKTENDLRMNCKNLTRNLQNSASVKNLFISNKFAIGKQTIRERHQ